jgi:hypothetical protein
MRELDAALVPATPTTFIRFINFVITTWSASLTMEAVTKMRDLQKKSRIL